MSGYQMKATASENADQVEASNLAFGQTSQVPSSDGIASPVTAKKTPYAPASKVRSSDEKANPGTASNPNLASGAAAHILGSKAMGTPNMFIMQLPPIMPELVAPGQEPAQDLKTKKDPFTLRNPLQEAYEAQPDGPFSEPKPKSPPHIPSGRVGKLRVHESGKVTIDWGGIQFEVKRGIDCSFLQEVVSTKVKPPEEGTDEDIDGDATCLGSVDGKFVVAADLDYLFGNDD